MTFNFEGEVISGDSSGNIIVWGRDKRNIFYVKHTIIRAHEKSVFSLAHLQDGTLVSGGGLDRRIIAWDGAQDYRSAKAGRQVSYFRSNHTISLVKQSSEDRRFEAHHDLCSLIDDDFKVPHEKNNQTNCS